MSLRAVLDTNPDKPIVLFLNSEGGSVHDALAIHDSLANRNATIIATGQCSSAAMLVLLAASSRYATPNCRFMTHAISAEDAKLSLTDRKELGSLREIAASIITSKTGMSPEQARNLLQPTAFYFGIEVARSLGIVHDIYSQPVPTTEKETVN